MEGIKKEARIESGSKQIIGNLSYLGAAEARSKKLKRSRA